MVWGSGIREHDGKKMIADPRSGSSGHKSTESRIRSRNTEKILDQRPWPFLGKLGIIAANFKFLVVSLNHSESLLLHSWPPLWDVTTKFFSKFSSFGNFRSLTLACGYRSRLVFRQATWPWKILLSILKLQILFIFSESDNIQGASGIDARFLKWSPASAVSPIMTKFSQCTPNSTCYLVLVFICWKD